jgi:putative PIN family toxin of toxin-antitoxin system
MNVVLDTNVLLVSLPPRSPYRPIFEKLLDGSYTLVISNEILTEYEEKITERYDAQTVRELLELFVILPNVQHVTPYFRWHLIVSDPDDDKFADVAISANVDYLVTNDKHFNILNTIDFPKVTICRAKEFRTIVLGV